MDGQQLLQTLNLADMIITVKAIFQMVQRKSPQSLIKTRVVLVTDFLGSHQTQVNEITVVHTLLRGSFGSVCRLRLTAKQFSFTMPRTEAIQGGDLFCVYILCVQSPAWQLKM